MFYSLFLTHEFSVSLSLRSYLIIKFLSFLFPSSHLWAEFGEGAALEFYFQSHCRRKSSGKGLLPMASESQRTFSGGWTISYLRTACPTSTCYSSVLSILPSSSPENLWVCVRIRVLHDVYQLSSRKGVFRIVTKIETAIPKFQPLRQKSNFKNLKDF